MTKIIDCRYANGRRCSNNARNEQVSSYFGWDICTAKYSKCKFRKSIGMGLDEETDAKKEEKKEDDNDGI